MANAPQYTLRALKSRNRHRADRLDSVLSQIQKECAQAHVRFDSEYAKFVKRAFRLITIKELGEKEV